jgi:uncharacterized membrane protein
LAFLIGVVAGLWSLTAQAAVSYKLETGVACLEAERQANACLSHKR